MVYWRSFAADGRNVLMLTQLSHGFLVAGGRRPPWCDWFTSSRNYRKSIVLVLIRPSELPWDSSLDHFCHLFLNNYSIPVFPHCYVMARLWRAAVSSIVVFHLYACRSFSIYGSCNIDAVLLFFSTLYDCRMILCGFNAFIWLIVAFWWIGFKAFHDDVTFCTRA